MSWRTLFSKVWYEGYPAPEYVWQSTGATDDFESKLKQAAARVAEAAQKQVSLEKEVVALIDVIEAEVPVQVAAARRAAK